LRDQPLVERIEGDESLQDSHTLLSTTSFANRLEDRHGRIAG
jgi:hypothetical protein